MNDSPERKFSAIGPRGLFSSIGVIALSQLVSGHALANEPGEEQLFRAEAYDASEQRTDLAIDKTMEGSCGEGKCGEGKCGEGSCGSNMRMDELAMVMNENKDNIPKDCPQISEDIKLTVKAGREYSLGHNGTIFGFDANEWRVSPCSRITVTFINEDQVRHQWMIHGLPKYLYPQGMYHMELNGEGQVTGTFIVPSNEKNYLVHCDIAQHMEKGMKAQLVVGKGDGNLPSIPGISGAYIPPAE
ncbi:MAG: multicopper oxidase domain-containing protein [Proteobacteria bacterium]|nr:multicopper oxidase domain-containing protein [Pseudomonadota bacterium]